MIKKTAIIIFLFFSSISIGQQIDLGISFGANIYQKTSWNDAFFIPENSYHSYYEEHLDRGLLDKNAFFNAFHIGTIISANYKRFAFNIEPQFFYQKTKINFRKPFDVEFDIGNKAFRMPSYFTLRIFKRKKSPFILAGFNLIKEKNFAIQNPGFGYVYGFDKPYEDVVIVGDNHFNGALYDNKVYWNSIIGLGKTSDSWTSSIRLQSKLDITKHSIRAEIWQIEFSFNYFFLSSKDFTNKHYLYVD